MPAPGTEAPVGIFDSGFGGLTVARAVIDLLPYEDIVYLGDTARCPYGDKPIAEVREYALECLDHLVAQGVKALVIACNAASAAVLRDARERYSVPVVEVISPAARRAAAATRNGRVGVICTEATATSQAYDDAFAAAPTIEPDHGRVPALRAVRGGGHHRRAGAPRRRGGVPRPARRARRASTPSSSGCTHYPLLTGVISLVLGDSVTLVSSADEGAKAVYAELTRRGLTHGEPRASTHRFLTTGNPEAFERLGARLLNGLVSDVEQFV